MKKTSHFEPSLLELDENISRLLTEPYTSMYRVEITCYEEPNFIRKKANIKYWIENPLLSEAQEVIDGAVMLYSIPTTAKEDLFKVSRLAVKIDDEAQKIVTDQVEYDFNDGLDAHNYTVRLKEKGSGGYFSFRFKKTLEVEIEDERLVPKSDNIYIKRIKIPTKNFQIHYTIVNSNCKLQGACMGTMVKSPSEQARIVTTEKTISIESFDWLLPGNGIMIASIPK